MSKLKHKIFFIGVLALGFFFGEYSDYFTKFFADTKIEVVTVSNDADAANVNFNDAPHFNNFNDLSAYLKQCKKNLRTNIPVVLTNGFSPNLKELIENVACWNLKCTTYKNGSNTTPTIYEITNYPGERVAYAYLHNDTSFLSNEEKKLYKVAVQIVKDAKNFSAGHSSPALYQELYIHDKITERVNYFTERNPKSMARFQSAIGALIDGRANCQGYSDAFYMLATMCHMNVDKIAGHAGNEAHMWNVVNFGDNRSYFVDVTWDDASYTFSDTGEHSGHIYFNAPSAVMTTHKWKYAPANLQRNPDGRYFYCTKEFTNSKGKYFGAYLKTPQDALKYIAKRIANGWNMSWVCSTTYDKKYSDPQVAIKYLTQNLLPNIYGWYGGVSLNLATRGNFMFFTVEAKRG